MYIKLLGIMLQSVLFAPSRRQYFTRYEFIAAGTERINQTYSNDPGNRYRLHLLITSRDWYVV